MSTPVEEGLEKLRHRATCCICRELFKEPKQLPNCPHVLCLMCLKQLLQRNVPINFPPCPMCRKPITKTLQEIDFLEPARAEEDIVDFVRPYEICDLCKKKERPTLKCLQCNSLICGNCVPVHNKLQTLHSLVPVLNTGGLIKHQITSECEDHPNQTLDLFCLMCSRNLCIYCEKLVHDICRSTYDDIDEYMRHVEKDTFLKQFILSDKKRESLWQSLCEKSSWRVRSKANISTPVQLRIVQINEFSSYVRKYLSEVVPDLHKGVKFFTECIGMLENKYVSAEHTTQSEIVEQRKEHLKHELDRIRGFGDELISRTSDLTENSTDLEVAQYALSCRNDCFLFLAFRKNIFDGRLLFRVYNRAETGPYTKRKMFLSVSDGSMRLFFDEYLESGGFESQETSLMMCHIKDSLSSGPLDAILKKQKLNYDSDMCSPKQEGGSFEMYDGMFSMKSAVENTDEQETDYVHTCIERVGSEFSVRLHQFKYISSPLYTINAVNNVPLILPITYDNDNIQIAEPSNSSRSQSSHACFCGTDAGIEVVFLDDGDGCSHGILVNAKEVRFNRNKFVDTTAGIKIYVYKDESERWSFYDISSMSYRKRLIAYHSKNAESNVNEFICIRVDGTAYEVPVVKLEVDLLCEVKRGFLYVKHKDKGNELIMVILHMTRPFDKENVLFSVTQADTKIAISRLRPFTISETKRGDIVVVCIVDGDPTKLVMILPVHERVVIKEIRYTIPDCVESKIVDLEMDSDENIMVVLRYKGKDDTLTSDSI